MYKKNFLKIAAITVPLFSLLSCTNGEKAKEKPFTDDTTFNGTEYYDKVETRSAFDLEDERNIDEKLSNGKLNDDYWNTLSGVWQNESATYPHNGVQKRNLLYVKDNDSTYLAFRGRGMYNTLSDTEKSSDGYTLPEGACIITKNKLGPGRYEFEMAAMPRYGGVSAAWTYLSESGNELTSQNEIDIEIGGEAGKDTFTHEWCTSWTKKTNKSTKNIDTSSVAYLNDGAFHKYTFDWYTNYLDEGKGRVDWFIDGILICSISGGVVTDKEMPLWIGLWFPSWTNMASFDTDYLLLKSAKYTAFDTNQPYEEIRAKSGYTQEDPSKSGIQNINYDVIKNLNKISNPSFESFEVTKQDQTHNGWISNELSTGGEIKQTQESNTSGGHSFLLTTGENETSASQWIECSYEGYKFDYSFLGKLVEGSEANIEFHYWNSYRNKEIAEAKKLSLTKTSWEELKGSLEGLPEKCYHLEIRLAVKKGSAYFDESSLIYRGCK